MISLNIIGTGNLARNLAHIFHETEGVVLNQVIGRSKAALSPFAKITSTSIDFNAIKESDVSIIAVKDDVIKSVGKKLISYKGLIAHTSGGMHIDVLSSNKNIGVFYPLQTFTTGKPIDFKNIPICIEANGPDGLSLLKALGNTLSTKVENISSHKRKILHLSAVFVNNFTNHLYTIGEEICEEHGLDFDLLKPLILETAEKVVNLSPKEAQTGPARREDQKTLHEHLQLLKENQQREIYKLLSNAIKASYEKKL